MPGSWIGGSESGSRIPRTATCTIRQVEARHNWSTVRLAAAAADLHWKQLSWVKQSSRSLFFLAKRRQDIE